MPNVERTRAAIVECHAGAAALDAMPSIPSAHACRVAPDELLLVGPPALAENLLRTAAAHLGAAESGTLVVDQSDAWAVFTIRGDDALRPLQQLSANPIPSARPAFMQGAVAGGAAKVLLVESAVHILVPYTLRDHLAGRLCDVCGSTLAIPPEEVPLGVSAPALATSGSSTMVPR